MKCVLDPKSRSHSAQRERIRLVSANRSKPPRRESDCETLAFTVLTNYSTYHIVVAIRMPSRNSPTGSSAVVSSRASTASDSREICNKRMGKSRSSDTLLFLPAPNRGRSRIAQNDMSIAGYVLKTARAAKGSLPGRAFGPGDISVGDRLQAEGERVRGSPAIKPMKLVQVGPVSELDKAAQAVPAATLVFDD